VSVPTALHDEAHDEEVRFAVVLNGGVSLAIWMGGVAREIDRLTRARPGDGGVYGEVLALVQARARADVIAGTSAGGINGAFLALGQAYENADLFCLRDLWGSSGSFSALLRSPVRGPLPSLLKGDDYFLPELRKGFDAVVRTPGSNLTDVGQRPVDLFLTTTVPAGQRRRFTDVLEQPLWEIEHTGRFTFSRRPQAPGQAGVDQFADQDIRRHLALAARSTASFPAAFEPSFVPVGADRADELHPDMTGLVNLAHSRYVIDGGVLMNKPMRLALRAVWQKPATTQVRRILLYVNPDPGPEPPDEAEPRDPLPPLRNVLVASITRLTLQQSIHEDLEELREANRRASDLRLARPRLLEAIDTPQRVGEAARGFFRVYRDVRAIRAAAHVADLVRAQAAAMPEGSPERLRGRVNQALHRRLVDPGPETAAEAGGLPYVPGELDGRRALQHWEWGIAPLERLTAFALDLLRRSIWLLPDRHELCAEVKQAREAVHRTRAAIAELRKQDTDFWNARARKLLEDGAEPDVDHVRAWADEAVAAYEAWLDDGGLRRQHADHAEHLVRQLTVVARVANQPSSELAPVSGRTFEHELLLTTVVALGIPDDDRRLDLPTLLGNLLAFEVCQLATAGDSLSSQEQGAQLVLVSAHTRNWFATTSTTADDKVAGLKLNHFGAFYKESWRINDWIWGRVDGVTQLMEVLLEVDRLRQLAVTPAEIKAGLAGLQADAPPEAVDEALRQALPADLRTQVERELDLYERERRLDGAERTLVRLHATANGFAYREHRRIVADELPRLAAAVAADELDGASRRSNGQRFAIRYGLLAEEERQRRALELLDQAQIGAEPFSEEFGTDLFSRTASTAAAGTVGAVDDKGSGLGRLRAVTRPVRGLTLMIYALVVGMSRGPIAAALVNLALAAGGALIAVSLLADGVPGWVTNLGILIVLAGLLSAALRSRMWNLALLAGPPLLFLVLYLAVQREVVDAGRLGLVLTVLAIVVGGWLLSLAREPARPPGLVHLRALWTALLRLLAVAVPAALILAALGWVRATRSGADWRQVATFLLAAPDEPTSESARDAVVARWPSLGEANPLVGIVVLVVLVAVAAAASYGSRRLARRRLRLAGARIAVEAPARVVSAIWMPWYGLAFGLVAAAAYGAALTGGDLPSWQPALATTALVFWLITTLVAPILLLRRLS
jgi:patatin-related protein